MKKIPHILLLILSSLLFTASLLYLFSGSQELFPTAESDEKVVIIAVGLCLVFAVTDVLLVFNIFKKNSGDR